MLHTPIGRLRAIALLEGASFVLLLFVAMPLKYLADMPLAVRIVGMAHGVLFIAFLVALGQASMAARWRSGRVALVFVAALLPFGPFVIDRRLRDEDRGPDPEPVRSPD